MQASRLRPATALSAAHIVWKIATASQGRINHTFFYVLYRFCVSGGRLLRPDSPLRLQCGIRHCSAGTPCIGFPTCTASCTLQCCCYPSYPVTMLLQ